jgi:hypothetical protein
LGLNEQLYAPLLVGYYCNDLSSMLSILCGSAHNPLHGGAGIVG